MHVHCYMLVEKTSEGLTVFVSFLIATTHDQLQHQIPRTPLQRTRAVAKGKSSGSSKGTTLSDEDTDKIIDGIMKHKRKICWRLEATMVLPGGSQRYQVSVSNSLKIETNCQFPLTLPPQQGIQRRLGNFWYTFSSKTLYWQPCTICTIRTMQLLGMSSSFS